MTNLVIFRASFARLEHFPEDLMYLPKVEQIYLDGNRLKTCQITKKMAWKELYLQVNYLSEFPKGILLQDKLQILHIHSNAIGEIPANLLIACPLQVFASVNVNIIKIFNCSFSKVTKCHLQAGNTTMQELCASENEQLDFELGNIFLKMNKLLLCKCGLKSLSPSIAYVKFSY